MAGQQQKVSILLTGSRDDQTTEELRGPLLQQNGSPSLSESKNTRLSLEPGTCTRAPDVQPIGVQLTAGAEAHGIVGSNRKRNYALYARPEQGSRIVGEDGYEARATGPLRPPWSGSLAQQSLYLPMQISSAGQLPGPSHGEMRDPPILHGIATCYNAVKDELWCAWTELQDVTTGYVILWVSCYAGDGTQLVVPTVVDSEASHVPTMRPVGLTEHGANGVRLWFGAGTTGSAGSTCYRYASLTVANGAPSKGATVLLPAALAVPDIYAQFSVTSQDSQYAYLAGKGASGGAVVLKVDVNAGTVPASVAIAGADGVYTSLHCMRVGGAVRVAAAFSGSPSARGCVLDDTLAFVLPLTAVGVGDASSDFVGAKFLLSPSRGNWAAFAASYRGDPVNPAYRTEMKLVKLDNSEAQTAPPLYWMRLYDQGAQWDVSATESYPLFTLARYYFGPMGVDQIFDPSLEVYILSLWSGTAGALASPVARFGCVRGGMSPAATMEVYFPTCTAVPRVGSDLFFTYLKADQYFTARFVKLSTLAEQPAFANDRDGIAIVAAALPVQWDGVETIEYGGPLHAPKLVIKYASAGDTVLETPVAGTYGFAAVFEWIDSAGLSHRSMPSVTQSWAFDGTQGLCVKVLSPDTMRIGWGTGNCEIAAVLYMTSGTAGTDYERKAIDFIPRNGFYSDFGPTSVTLNNNPIIYSRGLAGEELLPQPPPPLRDVVIIGSRAWGIDAEIPSRVVYSKLRVAGIGFEFAPALEVVLPSAAGGVVAIRELAGTIMLFAERGIFQLSDGGPNNMGQGGSFGSPYRVSETSTSQRRSVLGTPVGILFHDNAGGYSMLAGGQPTQLPGAQFVGQVTGGYLMEDAEEAVIIEGNQARVFNYSLGRFSRWELPAAMTLCAQSAISRDVGLLYAPSSGRTYTHDSHVLHPTALMAWETDWILFGGDVQDYAVAYEVLFNAYSVSDHAIRLELLTEYNGVIATTLREWTAAELAALFLGPNKRYTVKIESVRQDARAFKIRVQELTNTGNHRGMRPGLVTVVYSIDGLTYEEAIVPGSLK